MAKLLAGGASLIPLMKLRLAEPAAPGRPGRVPRARPRRGARRPVAASGPSSARPTSPPREVATALPILADASAVIADPLVRNVGTVGGNVAHGDPANDHPAVMLALDAPPRAARPGRRARGRRRPTSIVDLFADRARARRGADRDPRPGPVAGHRHGLREVRAPGRATSRSPPRRPSSTRRRTAGSTAAHRVHEPRPPTPVRAPSSEAALSAHEPTGRARRRCRRPAATTGSSPGTTCGAARDYQAVGWLARGRRARPCAAGRPAGHGDRRPGQRGGMSEHDDHRPSTARSARGQRRGRACCSSTSCARRFGLTGTHIGCDTTSCGACTVVARRPGGEVVHAVRGPGRRPRRSRRSRASPTATDAPPAPAGLPGGARAPVRLLHAGHDHGRVPFLEAEPDPTEAEIRTAISGNLCRCTGYADIVRSIQWAAASMRGEDPPTREADGQPTWTPGAGPLGH